MQKATTCIKSPYKTCALYVEKQQGAHNFRASDGWFSHWRWNFSITNSVRLHREADGLSGSKRSVQKPRLELNGYHRSNVFSTDEAGLFFRALPNRNYLLPNEDDVRKVGHGVKAMITKESVKIVMCANAWVLVKCTSSHWSCKSSTMFVE